MNKLQKWGLALASGIAAGIAWPFTGSQVWLIFIAFVPLLYVQDLQMTLKKQGKKAGLFGYAYTTFFVWNVVSTWWVWNASAFGAVMAILFNALFMTGLFMLYHHTRKRLGDFPAFFGLTMYWIAWEQFHMDWDLTWPWLTLGNIFASVPDWVQWYEFTGSHGGTVWIWVINLLGLQALRKYLIFRTVKASTKPLALIAAALILPFVASFIVKSNYEPGGTKAEVVIVQPNIDPYKKFADYSSLEQVQRIADLGRKKITPQTNYIVAPETAIPKSFREKDFTFTEEYGVLKELQDEFPNLNILIGASTVEVYGSQKPASATARYNERNDIYYDFYNTAVHISAQGEIDFYHKSKLVPGVELLPFPAIFSHFQEFAFDLGGTTGSLGRQAERSVFEFENGKIAPVICYESVYGEYVGNYLNNGAEAVFIITNDGWWGNTPGYRQHNEYARLRAIEHRKEVARSANTGISGFINALGEKSQQTPYWETAVISGTIRLNNKPTFYTRHGDYLARTSFGFAGLLLLLVIVRRKQQKTASKRN